MMQYHDFTILVLLILLGVIILVIYFEYILASTYPANTVVPLVNITTTTMMQLIGSPLSHIRLDEIYQDKKLTDDSREYSFELEERHQGYPKMINTPGCKIPVALTDYKKQIYRMKTANCGSRAVFIEKIDIDHVRVYINNKKLRKHLLESPHFYCCYQFIDTFKEDDNTNLEYNNTCNNLSNGLVIMLRSDLINVQCFEQNTLTNTTKIFYEDFYVFIKRNQTQISKKNCKHDFNVMLIGISSMSLPRFVQAMPRTIHLFKENFWLGFRGYHKVEDPSFLNLMAVFSGQAKHPPLSCNLLQCKELIWNRFRESGFITAFGEDIKLPGSFTDGIKFRKSPADHYFNMYPTKEKYCAGKAWTTKHLLNYAFDFANSYKNNSFFGIFWSNVFTHEVNVHPQEVDIIYEDFFNRLSYTRLLENTFIIFFSDHGTRYGEQRLTVESYYDERMPILFMWAPKSYGGWYPTNLKNTAINQFRLVTPYDLYNTLVEINLNSQCINVSKSVNYTPDCLKCQSIFTEINGSRQCTDVNIGESRCSCHNLYPLDAHDLEGMKTILLVISHIKPFINSIITKECWMCATLFLNKVLRINFYYSNDKTGLYYVVAFLMSPGDITFEATVLKKDNKIELVDTVSAISSSEGLGTCALNPQDQPYCFCQKVSNCH